MARPNAAKPATHKTTMAANKSGAILSPVKGVELVKGAWPDKIALLVAGVSPG